MKGWASPHSTISVHRWLGRAQNASGKTKPSQPLGADKFPFIGVFLDRCLISDEWSAQ